MNNTGAFNIDIKLLMHLHFTLWDTQLTSIDCTICVILLVLLPLSDSVRERTVMDKSVVKYFGEEKLYIKMNIEFNL